MITELSNLTVKNWFPTDVLFARTTRLLALLLVILLFSIGFYLFVFAWPSIQHFGWRFLIDSNWDPASQQFGALTMIFGTVVTSIIALIIAIPLSIGIAVTIDKLLPRALGRVLARFVELMVGIPSIIYGMWGLFFLAPFLASHVQPSLIRFFAHVPLLNQVFGGLPIGIGIFTAGLTLAVMIIPLIASVMRDVLSAVPDLLKESAYGVGSTRWEVFWHVMMPYTRAGLLGAIILGFGRALGETMAITFVIGNSHRLSTYLFMPGSTISATIANEFTEATGTLYPSALIELGLILFFITLVVLVVSRLFLGHSKPRGGSI